MVHKLRKLAFHKPQTIDHHDAIEEIRFRGFAIHGLADLCVVGILHIQ